MLVLLLPALVFVPIKGGEYQVGGADRVENYVRKVRLAPFEIAPYETTNAQFSAFVKATGYVTDAEKHHNAMVFVPPLPEFRWIKDPTANWRFPNGVKRGGIEGKMDHPVTTISYQDALSYCKWAGVRLPTLDEWEVACRAGTRGEYFFGSLSKIGEYANVWHGRDHLKPDTSDGYMYTSPVGHFKPNPWGLYDMYGNVFEFCSGKLPGEKLGSRVAHARGGSWWCSKNACCFFNSLDLGKADIRASFSNQGFRVARN